MKTLLTIVCAAFVALVLPACSTAPKKTETASCCASKGDGSMGKCDTKKGKHKH